MRRSITRTSDLPKFIDPASIENGDLIRVAWNAGGVEHARTAVVYRRVDEGDLRIFYTEEGYEIFHWLPGGPRSFRVTLLSVQKVSEHTALFDAIDLGRV